MCVHMQMGAHGEQKKGWGPLVQLWVVVSRLMRVLGVLWKSSQYSELWVPLSSPKVSI